MLEPEAYNYCCNASQTLCPNVLRAARHRNHHYVPASLCVFVCLLWQVRNAATLCLVALLTRVMGFRNVSKKNIAMRRNPTGLDFFSR